MLNRPKLSVVISPTVNERPASSACASVFGAKPSRSAARMTRSIVSARSLPCPLSAFDAVPTDTPADSATSLMVARRAAPFLARMSGRPGRCRILAARPDLPTGPTGPPADRLLTYLSRDSSVRFNSRENLFLAGWEAGPPAHARTTHSHHRARTPRPVTSVAARSSPTGSAIAAQHPLPAPGARLTGGLLHEWQRRNAAASMPLALHQLVVAGNLDNLQLAIRRHARNRSRPGPGAVPGAAAASGSPPAPAESPRRPTSATTARSSWTPTSTRPWRPSAGSWIAGPP